MNKPTLQKPPPPSPLPLPLALSLPLPPCGTQCGGQSQTRLTGPNNFVNVPTPSLGSGGRCDDTVTESQGWVSEKSKETAGTTKDTPYPVGGITSSISLQYELQQQIASIKWYEWVQLARYSSGQSQFAQLLTQALYAALRDAEWKDSTIVEQLLRVRCVSETDYVSGRREALELLELVSAYSNAKIYLSGIELDTLKQKSAFQFVAPSSSENGSRKRKLSRRPTPHLDSLLSKAKKYRKQENQDPFEAQSKFFHQTSSSQNQSSSYQSQILQNNNLNVKIQSQNKSEQIKSNKKRRVKRNSSCSSIPDTCQVIHQPKSENNTINNTTTNNNQNKSEINSDNKEEQINTNNDHDHELFILGTPHDTENKPIRRLLPSRLRVNEVCCIDSLMIGDRKVYKCEIVSLNTSKLIRAKQMALQHQVAVVSIQEKGHILLVPTFLKGDEAQNFTPSGNLEPSAGLFVLVVTTQHLTFRNKAVSK